MSYTRLQQTPFKVDSSSSWIAPEEKVLQVSSGSVIFGQAQMLTYELFVAGGDFAWPLVYRTDAVGGYRLELWVPAGQEPQADSAVINASVGNRIPAEVEVFAYANNIETVLYALEERARKTFPGVRDFSLSLESDPEGDKLKYVRVTVTLDADEKSVLSALSAFDDWLLEVLPDEKLLLVSVGVDFAADAAK